MTNKTYGSQATGSQPAFVISAPETVTIDDEQSPPAAQYLGESSPLIKVEDTTYDFLPVYRDIGWAVVFLLHMTLMVYLGATYGSFGVDQIRNVDIVAALEDETDIDAADLAQMKMFVKETAEYMEVYPRRIASFLVLPGALVAFFITYVWAGILLRACPSFMVKLCLLALVAWTIVVTLSIAIFSQSMFAYLGSAAMLAAVVYYVCIVWKLVPFASINLFIALKAISTNWGMYLVAFAVSAVGFIWTIFWVYVTVGLFRYQTKEYKKTHQNEIKLKDDKYADLNGDEGDSHGVTLVLLLISLYWASTVLLNTAQVTVAGVMGTWCYDKSDASSCCSLAVTSSLRRSVTYSFGSICFGSLLQALITSLRIVVENARNQRNQRDDSGCGAMLLCILECIIRLLEDIIDYFNQWAYIYVGIYGYSYLESGKKVIELFRARGWTSLVTNKLVSYVLGCTTFTASILTGLSCSALEVFSSRTYGSAAGDSYVLGPISGNGLVAFGLGFAIGLLVSSAMMNVIQGAVNTLIVCFADDPGRLGENHPEDTRQMADSWLSVFPDSGVRAPQYRFVV